LARRERGRLVYFGIDLLGVLIRTTILAVRRLCADAERLTDFFPRRTLGIDAAEYLI
jgi:hypothetical protein